MARKGPFTACINCDLVVTFTDREDLDRKVDYLVQTIEETPDRSGASPFGINIFDHREYYDEDGDEVAWAELPG